MSIRLMTLLFAFCLMGLMINVDYTALNLALVTITKDLHSHLTIMQWILSGYMLIWAAIVLPTGKAADHFGQKRFCLIGLAIFIIGSIIAGLAHSSAILIAARLLQGIAGAFYVPAIYALIFLNYPENRRGLAMGVMSLGVGLGMAIGPTFGGIILSLLTWRWIFFINIPIGLLSGIIIYLFAKPQANTSNTPFYLNKLASVLLAIALVCLMIALGGVHQWGGLLSPIFLGLILASGVFFMLFFAQQQHEKQPLVPFSLFKNTSYSACLLGILFEQYSFSACIVILALYFQYVLQFSVLKASLVFLALNLGFGVIAPFGGALIDKIGLRRPTLWGLGLFAIGVLFVTFLTASAVFWHVLVILVVMGVGMGLAFAALNSSVVKTVQSSVIGIASSVFILFALIGNVLGVVVSTALYEHFSTRASGHLAGVHAGMYATLIALVFAWMIIKSFVSK